MSDENETPEETNRQSVEMLNDGVNEHLTGQLLQAKAAATSAGHHDRAAAIQSSIDNLSRAHEKLQQKHDAATDALGRLEQARREFGESEGSAGN